MTKTQQTHYEGCWRDVSHHECAIARIEQLQRELAEAHIELTQAHVELTDACAARDALAQKCNQLKENEAYSSGILRGTNVNLAEKLTQVRTKLAQCRDELAIVDEALGEFHCPVLDPETDEPCGSFYKDHGVNVMRQALEMAEHVAAETGLEVEKLRQQLAAMEAERDEWHRKAQEWGRNTNTWSKKVIETLRQQLKEVKSERDETHKKAQDQSDEVQELWLSPVEAEGLRRQLVKAQIQAATPKKAVEWLWGYYDGNTLIAKAGYEEDIREAWETLLMAVDTIAGDALLERLTILDAAEAALADCGIGGINDEFSGLADAIEQMADHIKELDEEHDQLVDRVEDAMGQIEKYDEHIAENHIQYAVEDILERLVKAERGLTRRNIEYDAARKAAMALEQRLRGAEQRAEVLEQERDKWRGSWESVTAALLNIRERLVESERSLHPVLVDVHKALDKYQADAYDSPTANARNRIAQLGQRAERAESLAALVTPELIGLLEWLADRAAEEALSHLPPYHWVDPRIERARTIAAEIRRTLDDSKT